VKDNRKNERPAPNGEDTHFVLRQFQAYGLLAGVAVGVGVGVGEFSVGGGLGISVAANLGSLSSRIASA